MSWHYLQEQAAAFSLADYLAGVQSPPAKSNPTPEPSSSTTRNSETSPTSPSGTTSAPSTPPHSEATSTSSQAVSPVRTSQPQAKVPASPAPAPASGLKCTESFAKYNPATHTWKTPQCSLLEDLDEFSETWPKSGIMLHGSCWELPTAAPPTSETASGFSQRTTDGETWLTPQSTDRKNRGTTPAQIQKRKQDGRQINLQEQVILRQMLPTPIAHNAQETGCPSDRRRKSPGLGTMVATGQLGTPGALNPTWVEWLMGWPLGWTDLKHLATARFRSWLQQHSKSLNKD